MGRSLGNAPDEVIDQYTAEAEELGLSRAKYVRECAEVGRMIFQSSGEIDVERFREITEKDHSSTTESDLKIKDENLSSTILSNLSTEGNRALTKEEIRRVVFGTEDEQIEQITNTLKQLHKQDQIEPLVDGGYIKTNE